MKGFVIVATTRQDGLWPDQQGVDNGGGAVMGPFPTASEARAYLADNRSAWAEEPVILPIFRPVWGGSLSDAVACSEPPCREGAWPFTCDRHNRMRYHAPDGGGVG